MQNSTYLTPPELAKLLGINPSTVKRWVDRGFLPSDTTPGGHRRISQTQLQVFLNQNPKIGNNSYLLKSGFGLKKTKLDWKKFYKKLKSQEGLGNSGLGLLYISGHSVLQIITEVILPILRHIGSEWAEGNLDIFEEHRMTFVLRSELVDLEKIIPTPQASPPMVVLACIVDEQHELPLMLASLVLKSQGYSTLILGINTPAEEVAKAVNKFKAKVVILEKLYSSYSGHKYVKALKTKLNQNCQVLLAGNGWDEEVDRIPPKAAHHLSGFEELSKRLSLSIS